jgi:hypothetical protein
VATGAVISPVIAAVEGAIRVVADTGWASIGQASPLYVEWGLSILRVERSPDRSAMVSVAGETALGAWHAETRAGTKG